MDSEENDDIEILFPPLDLEVGTQVSVYWSDEDEFFNGQVERRHRRDKSKYLVQYDDGDAWWIDTREDQFSWPQSNNIKLPTMSERINVGSRVAVWWTKEKKYFHATVEEIREDDEKPHRLGYDDGDEEWTDLDFRKVYFLEDKEYDCEDEDYNNKSKSRPKKDILINMKSRKRKRNNGDGTECAIFFSDVPIQNKDGNEKQKVRRRHRTWIENFQELKQFYEEHGHTNIKQSHPTLGWFVRCQRETSILAKLTNEQRVLLASINFDTRTHEEKLNAQWDALFMKLKEFKNKNGNTHVSNKHDYTLANWCVRQRRLKKEGSLAEKRVKSLVEIGFDFKSVQQTWEENFQELKRFFDENGHSDVTQFHPTLGNWVKEYIRSSRGRSKLTDAQKEMLASVKFDMRTYEERLDEQWNESFEKLKDFKKKYGHTCVQKSQESMLARWISNQRKRRRDASLPEIRERKLEGIDFDWQINDQRAVEASEGKSLGATTSNETNGKSKSVRRKPRTWDEHFQELKQFYDENGHSDITQLHPTLGSWVTDNIRSSSGRSKLTDTQKALLASVEFDMRTHEEKMDNHMQSFKARQSRSLDANTPNDVDAKSQSVRRKPRTWDEHFQELKRFYDENGHSNIAQSHPTLGTWVKIEIRRANSRSELTDTQKAMLASVEFDMRSREEKLNDQWNDAFIKLKKFKSEHGHMKVQKSDDSYLARWVKKQKENMKAGSIRKDRKESLEEIDFEWN